MRADAGRNRSTCPAPFEISFSVPGVTGWTTPTPTSLVIPLTRPQTPNPEDLYLPPTASSIFSTPQDSSSPTEPPSQPHETPHSQRLLAPETPLPPGLLLVLETPLRSPRLPPHVARSTLPTPGDRPRLGRDGREFPFLPRILFTATEPLGFGSGSGLSPFKPRSGPPPRTAANRLPLLPRTDIRHVMCPTDRYRRHPHRIRARSRPRRESVAANRRRGHHHEVRAAVGVSRAGRDGEYRRGGAGRGSGGRGAAELCSLQDVV